MTQFDILKRYINDQLCKSGLTLSKLGEAEVLKRFNKSEANGGYSLYWHQLP